MESLLLFVAVVGSVWINVVCYQDVKPELNLATDDITILANSTLEIECAGNAPLHWIFPPDWDALIRPRAEVRSSYQATGAKRHLSILTIRDMEYSFTGQYICNYRDGPQPSEYSDYGSASVYVYVYDENHLLAPLNNKSAMYTLLTVHSSKPLTIPCRPTRPEIKVELSGLNKEGELYSRYDPRLGFVIDYPMSYHSGVFKCTAQYQDIEQDESVYLHFIPESTIEPHPVVDAKGARHPVVNGSFYLTCNVHTDLQTTVYVDWIVPQGVEDEEVKNTTMQVIILRSGEHARKLTSQLEVKWATKGHTGNYTCIAITHKGRTKDSAFVQVHDRHLDPYVSLTSHLGSFMEVNASSDATLVVDVETQHSSPGASILLHADWNKDGLRLEESNRVVVRKSDKDMMLTIKNVMTEDAGNYTLMVKMGSDGPTANWTITIYVRSKPQVYIRQAQPFYEYKKRITIKCGARGYPKPKVWWRWRSCTTYPVDCDQRWTDVDRTTRTLDFPNGASVSGAIVEKYDKVSRNLTFIANISGYFLCMSSNDLGTHEQSMPFIVADDARGLWVSDPMPTRVEGQGMHLTCRASKLVYSAIVWGRRVGKGNMTRILSNETGDIDIVEEEIQHSLVSRLIFLPLNMSHAGMYNCTAIPRRNGTADTVLKDLQVTPRSIPRFVNESWPSTLVYELDTFENVKFVCDHRFGVPEPIVDWYKNGEIHDHAHRNGIEERDSSLVITRVMAEDAGLYTCKVFNDAGSISRNFSLTVRPTVEPADSSQWIYIGVFAVVMPILIGVVTVLLLKICKERRDMKEQQLLEKSLFDRGQMTMFNPDLPLDEQVDMLPYNQKWEFPRDRLKLGRVLGQGAFGRVVKAEAIGLDDSQSHTTVAVKMLKERADSVQLKALVAELKILIHLGSHLNILNLLGAVTKHMAKGELMVIVEYCRYGNMRNYLLRYRNNFKDQLDPVTGRVDINRSPMMTDDEDYLTPNDQVMGNGFSNPNYQANGKVPDAQLNYINLSHGQSSGGADTTCMSPGLNSSNFWDSAGCSAGSNGTVRFRSRLISEASTLMKKTLCTCDLLCFAFQCARGMEYLESRRLIHRDLAARNVLLAEDNIVKICDFGLAKDCYKDDAYVKKNDGPLPIKWMAIESIGEKVFTTKSDVWSFGVLLWEFFTLGGNPYPGIELDEDFYRKLKGGYRMDKPRYAPDDIFALMNKCWHEDPLRRPSFASLSKTIGDSLETGVRQYYVDLNNPYMEINCKNQPAVDYLSMSTAGEGSPYLTMVTDSTAHYDNVTNVRPVEGEGPAPLEPLEVVPMIQLEPVVVKKSKSFRKAMVPPKTESGQNDRVTLDPETGTVCLDRYPSTEDEDVSGSVFDHNVSSDNPLDKSNDDYITMSHMTHLDRSRKGNESLRSAASSGFHSDFETPEVTSAPPSYNLVIENTA